MAYCGLLMFLLVCDPMFIENTWVQEADSINRVLCPSLLCLAAPPCLSSTWECNCATAVSEAGHYPQVLAHSRCLLRE